MTREQASKVLDTYGLHLRRRGDLFSVKIQVQRGPPHIVACETIKETVRETLNLLKMLGIKKRNI